MGEKGGSGGKFARYSEFLGEESCKDGPLEETPPLQSVRAVPRRKGVLQGLTPETLDEML